MRTGFVYLGGVLEYITASLLESAGDVAKFTRSVTESTETCTHSKQIRKYMDKNPTLLCKYDEDVFARDINRESFMIRPLHIRRCIQDDDELFWLQQAVINNDLRLCDDESAKHHGKDIECRLNTDCVGHICSFFQGDLPMLSSLARVNTKFYVMTGSNHLWKPIALRCFLFNPHIVAQIEANDESAKCKNGKIVQAGKTNEFGGFEDYRSFVSWSKQSKFAVLRERWMRQQIKSEAFALYVRINPVYIDLQERFYQLLYDEEWCHPNIDKIADTEMYDLFGRLLEIFANKDDFLTVSEIVSNAKCLDFEAAQYRLLRDVFGKGNKNRNLRFDDDDESALGKALQIERENVINIGGNEQSVLFVELPLSRSCFSQDDEDEDDDMDGDYYRLWIGRHTAIFAQVPNLRVHALHNHRARK